MKRIMLLAGVMTIAACSQSDTAAEPEATAEATEAAAAPVGADGGPASGSYKITTATGEVYMEEVKADGTFTSTGPDGETKTGTWEQKTPELYCTTLDEDGAEQKCHTETVGDDGVWTSTDPDGETVTVERVTA